MHVVPLVDLEQAIFLYQLVVAPADVILQWQVALSLYARVACTVLSKGGGKRLLLLLMFAVFLERNEPRPT